MPKLSRSDCMTTVRVMPNSRENEFLAFCRQVASRRLPPAPMMPEMQTQAPPKPRKTEAERAQPSKASLVHMARQRGLKGCTQMSREALARALAN
jgi:hypothetical protein